MRSLISDCSSAFAPVDVVAVFILRWSFSNSFSSARIALDSGRRFHYHTPRSFVRTRDAGLCSNEPVQFIKVCAIVKVNRGPLPMNRARTRRRAAIASLTGQLATGQGPMSTNEPKRPSSTSWADRPFLVLPDFAATAAECGEVASTETGRTSEGMVATAPPAPVESPTPAPPLGTSIKQMMFPNLAWSWQKTAAAGGVALLVVGFLFVRNGDRPDTTSESSTMPPMNAITDGQPLRVEPSPEPPVAEPPPVKVAPADELFVAPEISTHSRPSARDNDVARDQSRASRWPRPTRRQPGDYESTDPDRYREPPYEVPPVATRPERSRR